MKNKGIKTTSKARVNHKSLLIQLDYIDQFGNNLKTIRNKLNISKQALYQRLKRLMKQDLVKRIQSYPFAIYELTSYGQRVKQMLVYNEKPHQELWDVHNFVVKFKIKSMGNYRLKESNTKYMNNWHYVDDKVGDFIIRVQSNKIMRIFCPRRTTFNPEQEFTDLGLEAYRIASHYYAKYNMIIDSNMKISRKGHKTLKNAKNIAKLLGKFHIGNVWTDDSEGDGDDLEEAQDCNKIELLLDLPQRFEQLMDAHNKLAVNLNMHINVLEEIRDAIREFRNAVKEMKK